MAVTKAKKQEILSELIEGMKSAKSVVFADFQGMSVKEVKGLRRQLSESGGNFKVAKKTLLKIAAKEAGYAEIPNEVLEGPVGAAFSMEDEMAALKLIHSLTKKNENLKLRGAIFEGKVLSIKETKELALLPGKEELIGKFVYLIKSPIQGFHGVLYNTMAGFARVLDAIREKQEKPA